MPPSQWPLLNAAQHESYLRAVKLLLQHDSLLVLNEDSQGMTPMHYACIIGSTEIIKKLISVGSRFNNKSALGMTPLYCACKAGHVEVAKLLIDSGAPFHTAWYENNSTLLQIACAKGHVNWVNRYIESGFNVGIRDRHGKIGLHAACENGHEELAGILIEAGCEVNGQCALGFTPLHYACQNGLIKTARRLLDAGADPVGCSLQSGIILEGEWYVYMKTSLLQSAVDANRENSSSQNSLRSACLDEATRFPAATSSAVDDMGSEVMTSLCRACANGQFEVVESLIRTAGAYSNNTNGWKPLHFACAGGHAEIVQLLLENGSHSHISYADEYGRTALHKACAYGRVDLIDSLVKAWSDVKGSSGGPSGPPHDSSRKMPLEADCVAKVTRALGMTPLYIACKNGHVEVAKLLIYSGATFNVRCYSKGWTPLHVACAGGYTEVVNLLLVFGIDVNIRDKAGRIGLHLACDYGHEELVETLVEAGSEVDVGCRSHGFTPLHYACHKANVRVIVALIDSGANVNAKDARGKTPLCAATRIGQTRSVDILLKRGATLDLGCSDIVTSDLGEISGSVHCLCISLHHACLKGHETIARRLLESGAELNKEDYRFTGMSPLHLACESGNVTMVKILLEHKPNLECKNMNNLTPYEIACSKGHLEVMKVMVDAGANIANEYASFTRALLCKLWVNNDDEMMKKMLNAGARLFCDGGVPTTFLRLASQRGHHELAKLFLQGGAKVDAQDGTSLDTPLHHSAGSDSEETVKVLLDSGADMNQTNRDGETPLYKHSKAGNVGCVRLLIHYGAIVGIADCLGNTALHVAQGSKVVEICDLLVNSGAVLDEKNAIGQTPLHKNCERGNLESVQFLVQSGADVNMQDDDGNAPLHYVRQLGNDRMVRLILDAGAMVDLRNNRGCTPLHMVCGRHNLDAVETLLAEGADIHAEDNEFSTALHYVFYSQHRQHDFKRPWRIKRRSSAGEQRLRRIRALYGKPESVIQYECCTPYLLEVLLKAGANASHKNLKATPLHLACRTGDLSAVKVLLRYGADLERVDAHGDRPIHVAELSKAPCRLKMVQLLLDLGADANAPPNMKILSSACSRGDLELVKIMFENGYTAPKLINDECSLLELAASHPSLIPLLLDYGVGEVMWHCSSHEESLNIELVLCLQRDALMRHCLKVGLIGRPMDFRLGISIVANNVWRDRFVFSKRCEEELGKMKSESIGDTSITFHELLHSQNTNALLHQLSQPLTSDSCRQKFPIYGNMIYSSYVPLKKPHWKILLTDQCSLFFDLTDLPCLPIECVSAILEHLAIRDLVNLMEIIEPCSTCRKKRSIQ